MAKIDLKIDFWAVLGDFGGIAGKTWSGCARAIAHVI